MSLSSILSMADRQHFRSQNFGAGYLNWLFFLANHSVWCRCNDSDDKNALKYCHSPIQKKSAAAALYTHMQIWDNKKACKPGNILIYLWFPRDKKFLIY